ncbi:MAG TPA: hypothetical protein VIM64_14385 [Puia sp.]
MKYNPGDGLLFKVDDHLFLSGIVLNSPHPSGKYVIAPTSDRLQEKPSPGWSGENVLAQEHGMDGQSFFMVETILMDKEYVDGTPDIELVCQVPLTAGNLSHGGFVEIGDLAQLRAFHDEEMLLRQAPAMSLPEGMILRKCYLTVAEVLASIPPPNEFPTVKLYKEDETGIHYWQLYGNGEDSYYLVENWGIVGGEGDLNMMKDLSKEQAREAYDFAVRRKEEDGFSTRKPGQRMILQFRTMEGWGGMNDLDFRHEMEEYINKYLYFSGNGSVSGGDIGSGTMNIFFEVISPSAAVATVIEALTERKIVTDFLIVHENRSDEGYTHTILHPADYQGKFYY